MERLTVNDLNKVCYDPWELCGMDSYCKKGCYEEGGCTKGCHILKMYRKLAEYEDLEEQGKLLKLPCTVGDTVYRIEECGEITELEVLYITFFGDEIQLTCKELKKHGEVHHYRPGFSIGRKVFYTKEAAEAALKEMSE